MPIEPLSRLSSPALLLENPNIDTDVIYPARFLLVLDREGIGQYAFHDWRKTPEGLENPDFPAPALMTGDCTLLVAGANFGCGSSREHAVWTLADLGIRCIIAPSFGEIFYNNCFKNGILPVALGAERWAPVRDACAAGEPLTVDLERLQLTWKAAPPLSIDVPSFRRDALLNGWDEIDLLLAEDGDAIRRFEAERRASVPWLFRPLAEGGP